MDGNPHLDGSSDQRWRQHILKQNQEYERYDRFNDGNSCQVAGVDMNVFRNYDQDDASSEAAPKKKKERRKKKDCNNSDEEKDRDEEKKKKKKKNKETIFTTFASSAPKAETIASRGDDKSPREKKPEPSEAERLEQESLEKKWEHLWNWYEFLLDARQTLEQGTPGDPSAEMSSDKFQAKYRGNNGKTFKLPIGGHKSMQELVKAMSNQEGNFLALWTRHFVVTYLFYIDCGFFKFLEVCLNL